MREPADLEGVSGLILPGGESTTMRQLIERWGLREPILDLAARGAPLFGTCAGMIVLAARDRRRRAADPAAPRRDRGAQRVRAPARLVRGRAVRAGPRRHARSTPSSSAPRSSSGPGPDVDVLARLDDGRIVAVRERNVIATAFHPELAGETRFHRLVADDGRRARRPGRGLRPPPAPDAPRTAAPMSDDDRAPPRRPGKVRAARLTDLAALGELSRLCQSDGADTRSLGPAVSAGRRSACSACSACRSARSGRTT